MTTIENFLSAVPLLHSWDGGKTWNTGGFEDRHLRPLSELLASRLPDRARVAETGMGASTILFLLHRPAQLVSIDPLPDVAERILAYCSKQGIDTACWRPIHARSEAALLDVGREQAGRLDLAPIDGDHGWPAVFVDFHFMNQMLKVGGLLIVDDIQLHSVGELARFLREEPGYREVLDLERRSCSKSSTHHHRAGG